MLSTYDITKLTNVKNITDTALTRTKRHLLVHSYVTVWLAPCNTDRNEPLCTRNYTHPVRRLEQPVYGSQLVDERQRDAESVQWRPRWIREVGSVRERIDVVQILNPARQ